MSNRTEEPIVINQIDIFVDATRLTSASVPISGEHDLGISSQSLKDAQVEKRPFEFGKGFLVPYVVPPHESDRYVFDLNMTIDDLWGVERQYHYELIIRIHTNGEKTVTSSRDLFVLLGGVRPGPSYEVPISP